MHDNLFVAVKDGKKPATIHPGKKNNPNEEYVRRRKIIKKLVKDKVYKQLYEKEQKSLAESYKKINPDLLAMPTKGNKTSGLTVDVSLVAGD